MIVVAETRVLQIEHALDAPVDGIGDVARLIEMVELGSFHCQEISPQLAVNLGGR
jgi:hypothetical protein